MKAMWPVVRRAFAAALLAVAAGPAAAQQTEAQEPEAPAVEAAAPTAEPEAAAGASEAAESADADAAAGASDAGEAEESAEADYPLEEPERQSWSFGGIFGSYDPVQLQRGLQVYQEVCAACHGLGRVAFRTLEEETGPWLGEEAVRAIAASYQVVDEGTGEPRPGRPADTFPEVAPAASAFAAPPPDLSLMAKARAVSPGFPGWLIDGIIPYQEAGPDYIHALLTGYEEAPEGTELSPGTYYNPNFVSGMAIAMPPPLSDGQVDYAEEDVPETVDQYARDVSAFLMWTAEPTLGDRKRIGFQAMIGLVVFAGLMYATKRRVWSKVKH